MSMDNLYIYSAVEYAEDPTRESPGRVTGVLLTYGEKAVDRITFTNLIA